jgi:hypothetical protein
MTTSPSRGPPGVPVGARRLLTKCKCRGSNKPSSFTDQNHCKGGLTSRGSRTVGIVTRRPGNSAEETTTRPSGSSRKGGHRKHPRHQGEKQGEARV